MNTSKQIPIRTATRGTQNIQTARAHNRHHNISEAPLCTHDHAVEVFDGYSFKGQYSVPVEDEEPGDSGKEANDENELPSVITDTVDISSERVEGGPFGLDEQIPEPESKAPEAQRTPLPAKRQLSAVLSEAKPTLSFGPVLNGLWEAKNKRDYCSPDKWSYYP